MVAAANYILKQCSTFLRMFRVRARDDLSPPWESYVPDELDDEFAAMLMTLGFFASKDLAEASCAETGRDQGDMATAIKRLFPVAVAEYAQLGAEAVENTRSVAATVSHPRDDRHAGYNR